MKNPCFEQGLVIQHAPNVGAFEQSCNYPNFYKGFLLPWLQSWLLPFIYKVLSAHFHPYQVHELVRTNIELLLVVF